MALVRQVASVLLVRMKVPRVAISKCPRAVLALVLLPTAVDSLGVAVEGALGLEGLGASWAGKVFCL